MQRIYNHVSKYYILQPYSLIENPFRLAILRRTRALQQESSADYFQLIKEDTTELRKLLECFSAICRVNDSVSVEYSGVEERKSVELLKKDSVPAVNLSEYTKLLEFMALPSAVLDEVGELVFVNQAFTSKFGYEQEELLLFNIKNLSYGSAYGKFETFNIKDRPSGIDSFEQEFIRSNGTTFWGLVQYSEFRVGSDKSFDLIQFQDITTQKGDLQRLETQTDLIDRINQNINEGIYRSEIGKGFVYVNDAFLKMFGYQSLEELNVIGVNNLYVDPDEKRRLRQKLLRQKVIRNEEILVKTRSGRQFIGSLSSSLSRDEKGKMYLDGALRDITDYKVTRKKLVQLNTELIQRNSELAMQEEELAANNEELQTKQRELEGALKELSDRNFELDQLMYKTSHDLRSPLSSILGLIQIMELDEDPENMKICLAQVKKSINRLDEFVKSMLDYGRANKGQLQFSEIDFNELLNEVLESLTFTDPHDSFRIFRLFDGMKDVSFVGDSLLIRVLFSNIISNAFKYADPGKDSFLKVKINATHSGVFITFLDNGIGIKEEHLDNIFDMFYRATEFSSGSGLGLYIVKQIVTKMKGKISLQSKFAEGTKIRVFLPNLNNAQRS
jgi:PAS domain S-box-containing protein